MTLRQDLRREWREDCRRLQAQWGVNGPTWPQWLAYKDEISAEEETQAILDDPDTMAAIADGEATHGEA